MLATTDRIDARLLAYMAAMLQPPVRPAKSESQAHLAELINARDGLVRDRSALKNREKNLTIAFLKHQYRQRLGQIVRHIEALDAEIAAIIAPMKPWPGATPSSPASMASARSPPTSSSLPCPNSAHSKTSRSLRSRASPQSPAGRDSGRAKASSQVDAPTSDRLSTCQPSSPHDSIQTSGGKYQQLIAAGKPAKIAITAIMRKLIVTANALLKADRLRLKSLA